MIIYTCPKCGHDLMSEVIDCYPPIHRDFCPSCGWSHSSEEEVIRIPFGGNSLNELKTNLADLTDVSGKPEDLVSDVDRLECTWL